MNNKKRFNLLSMKTMNYNIKFEKIFKLRCNYKLLALVIKVELIVFLQYNIDFNLKF